jgi:hypothetical protein
MTLNEFNTGTDRLEKFYSKQLEDFEKDVWYRELKTMSFKRYDQIIKKIFTECKFMPKLADIIAIHRTLQYPEEKVETEECNKCKNRGFIIYHEKYNDTLYEMVAKCTCKNAIPYKYYPSINEVGL